MIFDEGNPGVGADQPRRQLANSACPAEASHTVSALPARITRTATSARVQYAGRSRNSATSVASTLLAEQGVDTNTVLRLLGHTSPNMTCRYQHLTDELRSRAADSVDDALCG